MIVQSGTALLIITIKDSLLISIIQAHQMKVYNAQVQPFGKKLTNFAG